MAGPERTVPAPTAPKPVLDLTEASPRRLPGEAPMPPVSFRLMAGELALVDAPDPERAAWFADLCCGLLPLERGHVSFLGHDWAKLPRRYAAALRGRIGRVFARGGWIDYLDIPTNVLLAQLHHTRRDERDLREEAAALAVRFDLPGLPTSRPSELSAFDLARAGCIRAFLGQPALVVLESPLQGRFASLATPLLDAISQARSRGAAAIWLAGSDLVWSDRSTPATQRLRLRDVGLVDMRRAA
jgi:phospholipid/cholesterol/gamma-HCH transport system ATP-binding protein